MNDTNHMSDIDSEIGSDIEIDHEWNQSGIESDYESGSDSDYESESQLKDICDEVDSSNILLTHRRNNHVKEILSVITLMDRIQISDI